MGASDVDRLRECRAFGTLAGMATAGILFWGQILAEIFRVAWQIQQTQLRPFELNLLGGFLTLGILTFALGAGGVAGRWVGEHVIYPVRTGDNAAAMKVLTRLMIGGVGVAVIAAVAAALTGALLR